MEDNTYYYYSYYTSKHHKNVIHSKEDLIFLSEAKEKIENYGNRKIRKRKFEFGENQFNRKNRKL